jgi:hypothetical protein
MGGGRFSRLADEEKPFGELLGSHSLTVVGDDERASGLLGVAQLQPAVGGVRVVSVADEFHDAQVGVRDELFTEPSEYLRGKAEVVLRQGGPPVGLGRGRRRAVRGRALRESYPAWPSAR